MENWKLELRPDPNNPGHARLVSSGREPTTGEMEQVMHQLARMRSARQPQVAPTVAIPNGAQLPLVHDPVFIVQPQGAGPAVLGLRHPGYGWLYFGASPEFVGLLLEQLLAAQAGWKSSGASASH